MSRYRTRSRSTVEVVVEELFEVLDREARAMSVVELHQALDGRGLSTVRTALDRATRDGLIWKTQQARTPMWSAYRTGMALWWNDTASDERPRWWALDALRPALRRRPAVHQLRSLKTVALWPNERVWCTRFERRGQSYVAGVRQLEHASSWGAYVGRGDDLKEARRYAEASRSDRFFHGTDATGAMSAVEGWVQELAA